MGGIDKKWRGQIKEGKPLTIVGDGNQRRDFTHIIDIVDGLIKICFSTISNKDAWELGSGVNYSINEIAELFISKYNCKTIHIENQKGNYLETLRKNDDALKIIAWEPKFNIKEYIKRL